VGRQALNPGEAILQLDQVVLLVLLLPQAEVKVAQIPELQVVATGAQVGALATVVAREQERQGKATMVAKTLVVDLIMLAVAVAERVLSAAQEPQQQAAVVELD
jgi:hypothetical protein